MVVRALDLWNHWGTQILVLLSLALQVVLLLLAGIRRTETSAVPKFTLWLAYQLADTTAIYTIGHLSFTSAAELKRHPLVVLWAPFLLLHLGFPDNITAYALQDNELWLRHLMTLAVQVLGVAYVLYTHLLAATGDDLPVLLAAILMFGIGVVKYAEKTWALRCGNLDRIRCSLKQQEALPSRHHQFHAIDLGGSSRDEFHARRAHSFFHVSKHALVDSWVVEDPEDPALKDLIKDEKDYKAMWALMEVELSLMYDLLYTKAGVIHTWPGYCIRFLSPLAVAASLLLLQLSGRASYSGSAEVDVSVTYVLLAGAMVLETASLLRALGSTWTYAFLCATRWSWLRYAALCTRRWDRLRRFVKAITGGGRRGSSQRRWSGKIGQYNLLHSCSRHGRLYTPLLGRFARLLGYEEWWLRYHYLGTADIPDYLKEQLFRYIRRLRRWRSLNPQGVSRWNWGQEALETGGKGLYKDLKSYRSAKLVGNLLGVEFQEGIIIWHIGTDLYLANCIGATTDDDDEETNQLVGAIKMLSDYMFFLLVERPYMLPGLAQSTLYRRTRENLEDMSGDVRHPEEDMYTKLKRLFCLHDDPTSSTGWSSRDKLAEILYKNCPEYSYDKPRLRHAKEVAETLEKRKKDDSKAALKLLLNVWMDFLVYAANRCSRESHAKKLSDGGELTTILWLMTNYLHQGVYASKSEDTSTIS